MQVLSGSSVEFVFTGYRPSSMSVMSCTTSIFAIHNETVNIWTHTIGAAVWMFTMDATLSLLKTKGHASEQTLAITRLCHIMCIAMPVASSVFHTYNCIGETAYTFLLRTDIVGIHSLMFARTMMEAYLVFYCEPTRWLNFMMIAILLGSGLAIYGGVTMTQWPFIPQLMLAHVPLISFLIASSSLSENDVVLDGALLGGGDDVVLVGGGDAVVHAPAITFTAASHNSVFDVGDRRANAYVQMSLCGSLVGVIAFALYRSRFPECMWPGRFDLIGSSHQWWHVFTWVGPSLVLMGMLEFTLYRHDESGIGGCVV